MVLAQANKSIRPLDQRIDALRNAGKNAEAIPLAEQRADAVKSRYGEGHPRYAAALGTIVELLQAAGRGGETEPLLRRLLAIEEKSYGPIIPRSPPGWRTWRGR